MFTGIVTSVGEVRDVAARGAAHDLRLTIATTWPDTAAIPPGASIACAGCCLTAVSCGADWFAVDVSNETLSRTRLGGWRVGTRVNLERALRMGDELGGHLVSGHVDGLAELLDAADEGGSRRLRFGLPPALAPFVAEKGSVALDGVSLTVNAAGDADFGVNVVPHTQAATTLGALRAGDAVHLEIDTLARYVARVVGARGAA